MCEMTMCPNECGQPLVQHNPNEYYCKKCKKQFNLDDILENNRRRIDQAVDLWAKAHGWTK